MSQPIANDLDFRFGLGARLGLALCTLLLWLLLLGMAGGAALTLTTGEPEAALVLAFSVVFFLQLANIVARDCRMKWGWRILLVGTEAWLSLPSGRLLFGRAPPVHRSLAYADIRQVEWREEAITSLGMVTINRVYAARLKSGQLILLGEDRPIPKTSEWTTIAGEAAEALARQAGVPVKRLSIARGSGGFLTLWGTSRPPWPEGADSATSPAEARALHLRLALTNLIPAAVFGAVLLFVSLSGTLS
ncbi:MAG: hypothetical protein IPK75_02365 [Acidobacteria bacterium]|nr:hypothetical protein [Acidobacteriota bacterium]